MISKTAKYALRALSNLAKLKEGESMLGRDISELTDIKPNYLSKVLLILRNAGYIETTRGQGGGYKLSRPAGEIKLVNIVCLFDDVHTHNTCLLGDNKQCSDEDGCAAHQLWKKVQQTYSEFLENTTIDDISENFDLNQGNTD